MNITSVSYVMMTILKTACKGITWDTWSVSHISEQKIICQTNVDGFDSRSSAFVTANRVSLTTSRYTAIHHTTFLA